MKRIDIYDEDMETINEWCEANGDLVRQSSSWNFWMSSGKKTRKPNTDDRPLLRLVMWHRAFKAAHWHYM